MIACGGRGGEKDVRELGGGGRDKYRTICGKKFTHASPTEKEKKGVMFTRGRRKSGRGGLPQEKKKKRFIFYFIEEG